METIIDTKKGNYKIYLYKHKRSSVTGIQKPYELIILINMEYENEDFRETYHNYLNTKKEAMDIINNLKISKNITLSEKRILGKRNY